MTTAYTPSDAGRTGDGSSYRLNERRESQPADDFMGNTTSLAEVFRNLAILSGKPIPAPQTNNVQGASK